MIHVRVRLRNKSTHFVYFKNNCSVKKRILLCLYTCIYMSTVYRSSHNFFQCT